jgi:endonuclease NucS-like protein
MGRFTESRLRDMLAENLDLLEPGLRLHDKEHRLGNTVGAGGRMDILARDKHRRYVVVEVKRSDSTAREALDEIAKYTELLRREQGIPPEEIRAIIASTTWHELLIPASNFARDWSHDLRGYRLLVDEDARLVGAERVSFLAEVRPQRLTPVHFVYIYRSPAERDAGWAQILRTVGTVGSRDVVGVDLDFTGTTGVIAEHALYVAFGAVGAGVPATTEGLGKAEPGADYFEDRYPREYAALRCMTANVFAVSSESAEPSRFYGMITSSAWEVRQVRGTGAYAPVGLRSEADIIVALSGISGGANGFFLGTASTKVRAHWAEFRRTAGDALAGNDELSLLVDDALDVLEGADEELDVVLYVNNPMDLVQTLVFGFPGQVNDYAPRVHCTATTSRGITTVITGYLYWNGWPVPAFYEEVRRIYPDPITWMIKRNPFWDRQLLDRLGLHYTRQTSMMSGGGERELELAPAVVVEGKLVEFCSNEDLVPAGWREYRTLDTFVHHVRHEVGHLSNVYRSVIDIHVHK